MEVEMVHENVWELMDDPWAVNVLVDQPMDIAEIVLLHA